MVLKKIIYFISIALISTGCGLGRQEPLWQSGMFSADGKYYAYTYSITTIMGFRSRGGATSRQGLIKNYLQVIDLATHKMLLEKPYKSKGMLWLREIEGDNIWLQNLNIRDGLTTPVLFNITARKIKFNAKDLQEINPQLLTKSTTTFYKNIATGEICFEAADGRKYRIDPTTGKADTASGYFERVEDKNAYCYQTESSIKGFSISGDTRMKIRRHNSTGRDIISSDDFINPRFLAIDKNGLGEREDPTYYRDNFFILSDNSTDTKKDRQLTMLDGNTLQSRWSTTLPQAEQEMNNYDKERFFLKGSQLFVANSTHLVEMNADDGTIVQTIALYPKND